MNAIPNTLKLTAQPRPQSRPDSKSGNPPVYLQRAALGASILVLLLVTALAQPASAGISRWTFTGEVYPYVAIDTFYAPAFEGGDPYTLTLLLDDSAESHWVSTQASRFDAVLDLRLEISNQTLGTTYVENSNPRIFNVNDSPRDLDLFEIHTTGQPDHNVGPFVVEDYGSYDPYDPYAGWCFTEFVGLSIFVQKAGLFPQSPPDILPSPLPAASDLTISLNFEGSSDGYNICYGGISLRVDTLDITPFESVTGFDDLMDGESLANQYESLGVTFSSPDGDLRASATPVSYLTPNWVSAGSSWNGAIEIDFFADTREVLFNLVGVSTSTVESVAFDAAGLVVERKEISNPSRPDGLYADSVHLKGSAIRKVVVRQIGAPRWDSFGIDNLAYDIDLPPLSPPVLTRAGDYIITTWDAPAQIVASKDLKTWTPMPNVTSPATAEIARGRLLFRTFRGFRR